MLPICCLLLTPPCCCCRIGCLWKLSEGCLVGLGCLTADTGLGVLALSSGRGLRSGFDPKAGSGLEVTVSKADWNAVLSGCLAALVGSLLVLDVWPRSDANCWKLGCLVGKDCGLRAENVWAKNKDYGFLFNMCEVILMILEINLRSNYWGP